MTYEDHADYESIEPFEPTPENLSPEPPETEQHGTLAFLPPVNDPDILRVLAIGKRPVVNRFVHQLHQHNIAHYSEWTRLIPTPNPGEFMRLLTKRISIEAGDREAT